MNFLDAPARKYVETYPDFCLHCAGWGFIEYEDDPSPPGVSLRPGTMTFSDLCPECTDLGLCPRCKTELVWDTEKKDDVCPKCEWHSGCDGIDMS